MQTPKYQPQLASDATTDEETSRSPTLHILRPNLNSTATISSFQPLVTHSDLPAMLDELDAQTSAIWSGNLNRPEEMLSAQAHALDAIFNTLAQKAATAMKSGHLPSTEAYLRMALKAQSQARTTLEVLAEIKAPKSATFIRQANIAKHQQVNNVETLSANSSQIGRLATPAHEKEVNNLTNKLISGANHATLDTTGTRAAIGCDPQMETVGSVYRAQNRDRKGRGG